MFQMLVKITFLLFVAVDLGSSQDDLWYNMGDWDTHPSTQANPYRQTHQQLQRQMDWFGFAQHVDRENQPRPTFQPRVEQTEGSSLWVPERL